MGVRFGPFPLDAGRRQLLQDGQQIHLSPKALQLLGEKGRARCGSGCENVFHEICVARSMANVTISLSEETIRLARHIAVERGTSLSGLVAEYIDEIVARDERYAKARERAIERMRKATPMGVARKPRWKREDLHER